MMILLGFMGSLGGILDFRFWILEWGLLTNILCSLFIVPYSLPTAQGHVYEVSFVLSISPHP